MLQSKKIFYVQVASEPIIRNSTQVAFVFHKLRQTQFGSLVGIFVEKKTVALRTVKRLDEQMESLLTAPWLGCNPKTLKTRSWQAMTRSWVGFLSVFFFWWAMFFWLQVEEIEIQWESLFLIGMWALQPCRRLSKSGNPPKSRRCCSEGRWCGCPVSLRARKELFVFCCHDFCRSEFLSKPPAKKKQQIWKKKSMDFSPLKWCNARCLSKVLRGVEESFSQLCTDFRGANTRHEDHKT